MRQIAVALDLGTSGFRAQALDLKSQDVISTAITTRHRIPGACVVDHLQFALEMTVERAGDMVVDAINTVVGQLRVPLDKIVRVAVCGNPVQLSLLRRTEIRDLAFSGNRKLVALGVAPPDRDAAMLEARELPGLRVPAHAEVMIPPAVRHEIGSDALAMIIQTGMLEADATSLATDYGTNAEIALHHQGSVFTGSTAAGPALEGRHITSGTLAAPGAICDLTKADRYHRTVVLDSQMLPSLGPLVDLKCGRVLEAGHTRPKGITGTGAVAIVDQGMEAKLIDVPHVRIADRELRLGDGIVFTERDLQEVGKAIGSVRAGHLTLCHEAGIDPQDVPTAYMAGASGTYVDACKAHRVGMIPPRVKTVYQVGNTSLAMARDLILDPSNLERMVRISRTLRETHCLFAASDVFKKAYILELSYWTEGMPFAQYQVLLQRYGLPKLSTPAEPPKVVRTVRRDLDDLGPLGLVTVAESGPNLQASFDPCTACMECIAECPEGALNAQGVGDPLRIVLDPSRCAGLACRRCELACRPNCFRLHDFFLQWLPIE